jgi:hypothetical protein
MGPDLIRATRRRLLALPLALGALAGCAAAQGGVAPASPVVASAGLPLGRAPANVVQRQPPARSCHARGSGTFTRPDARCTPGAVDPTVRQSNIASTICRRGYTRTVRPPESVTAVEKRASMRAYGDAGSTSEYEYDHLVPLELGGARNDARNLWPEPGATPNRKDTLENALRRLVCARELSLASAQRQIARDWVAAYRRYIG